MEITVGMKAEVATLVEREDTAKEVGSGSLLVYATPCMVALMEGAACEAIESALGEDKTTVGIELNIQHTWKVFGVFWDMDAESLRGGFNKAKDQALKFDFDEKIMDILR